MQMLKNIKNYVMNWKRKNNLFWVKKMILIVIKIMSVKILEKIILNQRVRLNPFKYINLKMMKMIIIVKLLVLKIKIKDQYIIIMTIIIEMF